MLEAAFKNMKIFFLCISCVLISCASYTKTFFRNGELLPLKIKTNCGTYEAKIIGISDEFGINERDVPFYPYAIFFSEDTAIFLKIDSLEIIRCSKSNKIVLKKLSNSKQFIDDTTYDWVKTNKGGYFTVLKADSFLVSFIIRSDYLSCYGKEEFVLKPIRASDKQLSISRNKCYNLK
jgi:hypothetical protein